MGVIDPEFGEEAEGCATGVHPDARSKKSVIISKNALDRDIFHLHFFELSRYRSQTDGYGLIVL
jgi:hypothetical protein